MSIENVKKCLAEGSGYQHIRSGEEVFEIWRGVGIWRFKVMNHSLAYRLNKHLGGYYPDTSSFKNSEPTFTVPDSGLEKALEVLGVKRG